MVVSTRRIMALWLPRLPTDRLTRKRASPSDFSLGSGPLVISGKSGNALHVHAWRRGRKDSDSIKASPCQCPRHGAAADYCGGGRTRRRQAAGRYRRLVRPLHAFGVAGFPRWIVARHHRRRPSVRRRGGDAVPGGAPHSRTRLRRAGAPSPAPRWRRMRWRAMHHAASWPQAARRMQSRLCPSPRWIATTGFCAPCAMPGSRPSAWWRTACTAN